MDQCKMHEDTLKEIKEDVREIKDFLKGTLEKPGMISRLVDLERSRKTDTWINRSFIVAILSYIIKDIFL